MLRLMNPSAICLAALLISLGCVSGPPKAPPFQASAQWSNSPEILIGAIKDLRDTRERGPTYLGTIRGGYGNPLARLNLDLPATEHLAEQLHAVLSDRDIATGNASNKIHAIYHGSWTLQGDLGDGPPVLVGTIRSYWAENLPWRFPFGGRRVEVAFDLVLLDTRYGRPLWTESLARTEDDRGFVGISGSGNTEPFRTWVTAVVQELVAEAMSDSHFLSALRSRE